ncbi:MAG TPA: hypothetical protein VH796_02965 [Nitrososphaeraceae archaeon]
MQTKAGTDNGKSESITFRLDNETIKNLRHEAKQQDISTNALVNHILKEHIKWHSNAPKAGFIAVRRSLIMNLMSFMSEKQIVSVAENVAKSTNKDSILLLEKEYTMKSALEFLENWMKISGYVYRHEETKDGRNGHIYVIQHDMGMKWSIYLASLYQLLFDELDGNNKRIEFQKTENTLVFTVNCT